MPAFQTLISYWILLRLHSVQSAIINAALHQPSWQSTTINNWNASFANDGDYDNDASMEVNSCSHTNDKGQYTAWWQVDLGQVFDVSYIKITSRDWTRGPERLAGFSIYVSGSRKQIWTQQELCYRDDTPEGTVAVKRRFDCSSVIRGRYLVIYNKRPPVVRDQNSQYSLTAILELCEVDVPIDVANCADYTCTNCNSGWYGKRCQSSCENCGGGEGCYKENGTCKSQSCVAGYYGNTCTHKCPSDNCINCNFYNGQCLQCNNYYFGSSCDQSCPSNCIVCSSLQNCSKCKSRWYSITCASNCSFCGGTTGDCYQFTGICLAGKCKTGFYGSRCNNSCPSNCGGDRSCDFSTGACYHCPDGKYGNFCDEDCPDKCTTCKDHSNCTTCKEGFYGTVCSQSCPGCGGNGSCSKSNGLCINQNCKPTYYGEARRCDKKCSTNCDGDQSCNDTSGECRHGCVKGYHGFQCSQSCPDNCKESSCSKESGLCSNGCNEGWNGTTCDSACAFPKFGMDCAEDCGHCKSNVCHHINGTCMDGCEVGWSPPQCTIEASAIIDRPSANGVSTGAISGAVGAVVVVIIVVIIVIVIIKRNKGRGPPVNSGSKNSQEARPATVQNSMYTNIMSIEEEKRTSKPEIRNPKPVVAQSTPPKNADESDRTYYNNIEIKKEVAVSVLKAYVTNKLSTNKYEEEFQAIPYGASHSTSIAETPKNMKKNRFKTTFPYDHSRVVLKGKSDYINANFIEDANGVKKYIATQGPIPNTIEDFWEMVWEYNIDIIVMLTNLQEGKKRKCEQYWPKPNEKVTHGQFGLSLLDERHFSYYSLRELEVLEAKTKQSRKVLQYHFTTWPDHGTPDPLFLVLFHKRVISKAPKYDGPILVHCSAGIGRTGTFIALDALESQGNNTGAVDIENYVRIMRKDRMNMIQTSEQYKVLHEALVEAFQWQDTYISMDDFSSVWQSIETDKRPLNQQRLKKEYDMLREMKGDSENPVSAIKEENKAKNRTDSILPLDKHRPYLSSYFAGGNDFINSVIIPSHLAKDGFMVTQVPLQGTIVDFWRLITDHDSRCIVYFAQSSDEETNFYPSHEDVTDTEMHIVKKESSNTLQEGVEEVKMKVKGKKSNQTKDVTLLKIDMAGKNYPTGAQIFRAVEIVELQRSRNKNSPCTVVSLDGGTPCEVFCAISNILEYMKVDNRIDVFQTARQLQIRRPEFFETFETYRYCYQMINEYLMTQSVYFNM